MPATGAPPAGRGGPTSPNYFPNVDFLRAAAALLVLVYHVIELAPWPAFPVAGAALVLRTGWMGVDLFFVVSGFVIGMSAIALSRSGDARWRVTFARRRVARIVPLYVLTCAVFLFLVNPAMLLRPWEHVAIQVGAHLAFVHNLHPRLHSAINGPNWSVATEMQFYLVVAVAAPFLARVRVRWLLAGGLALAWASRAAAFWATRELDNPAITFVYATQAPAMADEFAVGLALARLHLDGTLARVAARCVKRAAVATAVALAAALWLAWGTYWAQDDYWRNPWMVVFWRTTLAFAFGALVLFATQIPDLTRAWPLRPLAWVGRISYGIYLWHLPVILSLRRGLGAAEPEAILGLALVGALTLSALTWHLLEQPLIRRFR